MLSSDKNIETIAQLIEVLKQYVGLQKEYLKFGLTEKVVRLLTAATLAIIFFLIFVAVMLFFWLGTAVLLARLMGGYALAFFTIAIIHLVLLLLFVIFRKSWIERPLVRFLARLFLS